MKKFSLVLFILAAGACFFLGWVQFQVPHGSYGVLRSKTHGIDKNVIQEGRFRWVWYKLLPTNVEILAFVLPEISVPVHITGKLPSGDVYAAMAGLKTDFSYDFSGSVSCSLRVSSLPSLTEKYNLASQEDLDSYARKLASEIESFLNQQFWNYAGKEDVLAEAAKTGTIPGLDAELGARFPETENIHCSIKTVLFPDFILYGQIRSLYEEYLAGQKRELGDELAQRAAQNINSQFRMDELAKYGELLTKYPVLIEYLALERGIPPGTANDR